MVCCGEFWIFPTAVDSCIHLSEDGGGMRHFQLMMAVLFLAVFSLDAPGVQLVPPRELGSQLWSFPNYVKRVRLLSSTTAAGQEAWMVISFGSDPKTLDICCIAVIRPGDSPSERANAAAMFSLLTTAMVNHRQVFVGARESWIPGVPHTAGNSEWAIYSVEVFDREIECIAMPPILEGPGPAATKKCIDGRWVPNQ